MNQQHSSSSQPDVWIGRLVGDGNRYRLDQRLGGGGMGDVFLATDTRLGKQVALKLLKDSLAIATDLDLKERFERECAICAALKSVHIVQVSDYGVTAEGYPFYVMEYLQGQTLGQLLTIQPRLPIDQTCNIITQVCAGLQLAHEGVVIWNRETNSSERIKVVHRDLKPDNIFLTPTALGEFAKIIDFGIAKIHSLQAEYATTTSMFLGTCHYSSPEQFDIKQEVDERSDIYSLGVILYEMLMGIDPFGFDFRNNRITNNAWLTAHASKSPRPLRSQFNCQHISPALEAVVMQCLAKSPENRFASVADLRVALQEASSAPLTSSSSMDATTIWHEATALSSVEAQDNQMFDQVTVDQATGQARSLSLSRSQNRRAKSLSPRIAHKSWLALGGVLLTLAVGVYAAPYLLSSAKVSNSQIAEPSRNTPQLTLAETIAGNSRPVWSAVLSADNRNLVSAGEEQNEAQFYPIKIWNLGNGQIQRILNGHTGTVRTLSLSKDGRILVSGSDDRTIKIWNVATGELIRTLEGHSAPVESVALSLDGKTLVSGSADKTVRIWNLQTLKSQALSEHTGTVYSVAFSPDETRIASSGADKTIRIWNAKTGELLRTLGEPGGHRDTVSAVAFSPDGQQLASAGWDGFVKLWNTTTGQLLQTLEGHTNRVAAVTFVNQQTVASAGDDKTIKIWDTQSGQSLQTIPAHGDRVLSVTSPADQTLVSSSSDTTVKIWRSNGAAKVKL